jgi:hypothetical protein
MALTKMQAVLFVHRLRSWRGEEVRETAGILKGKILATTGEAVLTNEPCLFQVGQSNQSPAESFIYDEGDNLFTLDPIYTEIGTDIKVGDIVQQTTGPDAGDYWLIRGNAQGREQTGHQKVLATRLFDVPDWAS